MAVFGTDVDRPLYGRGPSVGLRFTVYAILSIVLMYYDQHGHWVQRLRYALDAAAYPVQVAVSSPRAAWNWLTESFQTRDALRAENKRLHDSGPGARAERRAPGRARAGERASCAGCAPRCRRSSRNGSWPRSSASRPIRCASASSSTRARANGVHGQPGGGRRQRRARPGRPRRTLELGGDPGHRSGARHPGAGDRATACAPSRSAPAIPASCCCPTWRSIPTSRAATCW